MIKNDFRTDLAYSNRAGEEDFWLAVYRKAFPGFVNAMPCPGDTLSQRMGIDRIILLSSGLVLRIDEKKRREEYDDILVEFVSNDSTGAVGWIEKELAINYIAYAFMKSKRVYLLDWNMLRRAWMNYKDIWKRDYKIIRAENKNYTTISVAVPIVEILTRVRAASIIDLNGAPQTR